MTSISVFVSGQAVPQGSKTAFRYQSAVLGRELLGVREVAGDRLTRWRHTIVDRVMETLGHHPEWVTAKMGSEAFQVDLDFYIMRPKSHYLPITKVKRLVPELRDDALMYPIGVPDVDKLTRAVLDALTTAGVWTDDAHVVNVRATKNFSDGVLGEVSMPGVLITVTKMLDL